MSPYRDGVPFAVDVGDLEAGALFASGVRGVVGFRFLYGVRPGPLVSVRLLSISSGARAERQREGLTGSRKRAVGPRLDKRWTRIPSRVFRHRPEMCTLNEVSGRAAPICGSGPRPKAYPHG